MNESRNERVWRQSGECWSIPGVITTTLVQQPKIGYSNTQIYNNICVISLQTPAVTSFPFATGADAWLPSDATPLRDINEFNIRASPLICVD